MHPAPWIRAALGALLIALTAGPAAATEEAADTMIKRLAHEVMEAARAPGEAADARSVNARGLDGLIATLAERNRLVAAR